MMADTPIDKQTRFLGDYLFAEPQVPMVLVGSLDDALLRSSDPAVPIVRLDNLMAAEKLARESADTRPNSQSHSQSTHQLYSQLILVVEANSPTLAQQLGRAIRAYPQRVVVNCHALPPDAGNSDALFYSLGFKKLPLVDSEETASHAAQWYEYRLSQYKTAPDWLNARFWANPERFDAEEDPDGYCEEPDDSDDENDDDES